MVGPSMRVQTEGEGGHGSPSVPGEEFRDEPWISGKSVRHRTVEADWECADEGFHGQLHPEGEGLILRRGRQEGRCDLADEPYLGISLAPRDLDHALDGQEE